MTSTTATAPAWRLGGDIHIAFLQWFPLGHGDLVGAGGTLARLAEPHGVTPAQLALAWLLRRSPNTVLIPGTTSVHLAENMRAGEVRLDDAQWAEVERRCSRISTWRPAGG